MNILVTGGNGFIGRSLRSSTLMVKHKIIFTSRKQLDVSNKDALVQFIRENNINIIIHTAIKGHPGSDSVYTLAENLTADLNILQMNRLVNRIIIFGSGIEYADNHNISNVSEDDLSFTKSPTSYYALGKYTISRAAECIDNVYNLRLFGCFGPLENNNRFIKNSINRVFDSQSISIQKDRYFDFFYIDDLFKLIEYYINNDSRCKQINCVYEEKHKLSDVANIIKTELAKKDPIILIHDKTGLDKSYTSESNNINFLGNKIKLKGLEQGIKEMIATKGPNEKN